VTALRTRAAAVRDRTMIILPEVTPDRKPVSHRANMVKVVVGTGVWAIPLLVPAGPGNTAPADVFLGFAVLIAILWFATKNQPLRFPYALPVGLAVLAGALASTVYYAGAYISVGGGLITLLQDVFLLAWALSIANLGRDPALLSTILRAWAISGPFWAAVMLIGVFGHISLLSGETARDGVRAAFTLGDPNLAANYFICSLLVLRAARYPRHRLARWICCALIVTAIVLTGSNGGALMLIVTTVLGALFRLAKRYGGVPAVITASALMLAVITLGPHVHVQDIVRQAQASSQLAQDSIGRQAESSGSRSMILTETIQLYLYYDTPIGIGPGGTKSAFEQHHFSYVKMAHDDYAAALVERGVLGGAALVLLMMMVAMRCRRIASRPLRREYAEIVPRPELLGAAVIGMFISATLYQVLHFRHLWALLGIVAAVDLFGRQQRGDDKPKLRLPSGRPPSETVSAFAGTGRHRSDRASRWSPKLHERTDQPGGPRAAGPRKAGGTPEADGAQWADGSTGADGSMGAAASGTRGTGAAGAADLANAAEYELTLPLPIVPWSASTPWQGTGQHPAGAADPVSAPEGAETAPERAGTTEAVSPAASPARRSSGRLSKLVPAVLGANVAARLVAIGALTAATILVAHAGGPKLLGELTLLRVLPGLIGVLVACGLPSAAPYFLAGRDFAGNRRVRPTLFMLTLFGSLAATGCWLALSPVLHRVFFHSWHMGVVIASTVPVFSQLWVAVGKSFLQGEHDMRGANWAIAIEEAAFLPVYVGLLPLLHGTALLLTALVGADVLVAVGIGIRLFRRGFVKDWGKPEWKLARHICRYGLRGQIGGMLSLLNLRLDVAILGALVGPGTLGVYAVASKYAELLRLPGLAITYVLYPRLATRDRKEASRDVAQLLPRAFFLTAVAAIPLAAAVPLLPFVYGRAFTGADIPAYILLFGLVGEGVAGLVSAYLYGVGRPGMNSLALGVSVLVTVGLDIALIPHYHAIGAAIASCAAYLTSSAALLVCYFTVRRLVHVPVHRATPVARAS